MAAGLWAGVRAMDGIVKPIAAEGIADIREAPLVSKLGEGQWPRVVSWEVGWDRSPQ